MFSCLFSDNMAQDSAKIGNGCGSSVVEHSLGKGEVESSILSRSTILFFLCLSLPDTHQFFPPVLISFPVFTSFIESSPFKPCILMASNAMPSYDALNFHKSPLNLIFPYFSLSFVRSTTSIHQNLQ